MMKTLKQTLKPRESVFDKGRRDVTLDLTDLPGGNIDADQFFAENYITEGMGQLYTALFKRLEGNSDDGIFKLTQAMGGGKTHNMITMGLMALHPVLRERIMGSVYKSSLKTKARVITFSGRQNADDGIWGDMADQLGKRELFKKFYADGLKAPGQGDWISLLQGEPLLIILDELPPYFQNASTIAVGAGTLADVTTSALSNLLVAIGKKELNNVALVLSDLSASYEKGSSQLQNVISDFEKETKRSARNFTPVRQNTDELYKILRKRIFSNEADEADIKTVAEAYAKALEKVNKMDLTNDSPQKLNVNIRESYPFHPSIRELYARFKENPGFMQTRGLIRLMRTVVSNMYDPKKGWADKNYLIHAYDIDPNDSDTHAELVGINNKLENAISNDIASSNGDAAAEKLSAELANTLPSKTARLIFISSLSNVHGSVKGLRLSEITSYLAEPGVDLAPLNSKVIPDLRQKSWYLHADNVGNLLYKNVQNISAKVNSYSLGYNKETIKKEIVKKFGEIFSPMLKDCYQKIFVLPAIDEIQIDKDKVSLIIFEPTSGGELHPQLQELYDNERFKNRMLFLTGDHQAMDSIYDQARGMKATDAAMNELQQEKVPANDPQMEEARTLNETYQFKFRSAIVTVFTKLYYPTKRGLVDANIQLKFEGNNYKGEDQIKNTLSEKRKFNPDTSTDLFVKKIEAKLFNNSKTLPWNDVIQNAAMLPDWDWHHPAALDDTRAEQLRQSLWRLNGDWVEKGPFPKPKTRVEVKEIRRNAGTGEVDLSVKPINGDTIYYNYGKGVSESCPKLDFHEVFKTDNIEIEFICADSKREHETGDAVLFTNKITMRYKFIPQGSATVVEIEVAPKTADIFYTTDGSNPLNNGGKYEGAFEVKPNQIIQIIGVKGEHKSETVSAKAPAQSGKVEVNKSKPLYWKRRMTSGSTSESFTKLKALKKHSAGLLGLRLSGVKGPNWIELSVDSKLEYPAHKAEHFLNFIQENAANGAELSMDIAELRFETGQQFLDLIQELKTDYKPEEIEQK